MQSHREFMDKLRVLLGTHNIEHYEHTAKQTETKIQTETRFSKPVRNVEELRRFLDAMRRFLNEEKVYNFSFQEIAKLTRTCME